MLKFLIIIVATVAFAVYAYQNFDEAFGEPEASQPVACTKDAMQCPDGSYVGRSGPSCQFVCPQ